MLKLNDKDLEEVTHKLLLEWLKTDVQCIQYVSPSVINKTYNEIKDIECLY